MNYRSIHRDATRGRHPLPRTTDGDGIIRDVVVGSTVHPETAVLVVLAMNVGGDWDG